MKIASLQSSLIAGDIEHNRSKILQSYREAMQDGADMAVSSELALIGYPSKDLLQSINHVRENLDALRLLSTDIKQPLIIGHVDHETVNGVDCFFNAASHIEDGTIVQTYHKRLLPNYDVFDEKRYFTSGRNSPIFTILDFKIGISICEDAWNADIPQNKAQYAQCPIALSMDSSPDLLINLSASPFHQKKLTLRESIFSYHSKTHGRPMLVTNHVGAHDDLLFDGQSLAYDNQGELIHRSKAFSEDRVLFEFKKGGSMSPVSHSGRPEAQHNVHALVLDALIMGIRDYATQCDFQKAILGVSGGIDSALTAAIAAEALGPKNVLGVAMPSKFSSNHSLDDAKLLASNLKINFQIISIEDSVESMEQNLAKIFRNAKPNVAEENIQARLRAVILMAISNKFGHLLLATGNKSEMSVGYTTLYGDMCGGLAVLADVYKTQVYQIAKVFNTRKGFDAIPKNSLTKPPSAELRPDQRDQDSLPPYHILDEILELHIEKKLSPRKIQKMGFDKNVVEKSLRLYERSEYKRFQSPPILRVSPKAFGPGRRFPIAGSKVSWK